MPSYIKSVTTTDGDTYYLKDARVDNITMSPIATTGTVIAKFTDADGQDTDIYAPDGGSGQTTWYGTSSTAASTAAKVVTCADFALTKGAIISVLFSSGNDAATPTLNVNSTGAKSIRIGNTTSNSTTNVFRWSTNTLITFVYSGSYYYFISAQSAASATDPDGGGSWYGTSSTGATTAAKISTVTIYKLTMGARVSIAFSNANTVEGLLTLNINGTGAKNIYFDGSVTSSTNPLLWDANEIITFVYDGNYYHFVSRSNSGGSEVSVTQTQTSGDEIGGITVDGVETKLYAPPQQSVPWVSFDDLTYPITFATNPSTTYTVAVASSDTIKNASEVLVQLGSRFLHFFNMGVTETLSTNFIPDTSTSAAVTSAYSAGADCQIDFTTGKIQARQYMKKTSGSTYAINGIWYRVDPNVLADANSTSY